MPPLTLTLTLTYRDLIFYFPSSLEKQVNKKR